MALKGTFNQVIRAGNLSATAQIPSAYMRLAEVRVVNRYVKQGEPVTITKDVVVKGTLEVYALSTDAANGVDMLASAEYECPHATGGISEVELYAYLTTLPEFSDCLPA